MISDESKVTLATFKTPYFEGVLEEARKARFMENIEKAGFIEK